MFNDVVRGRVWKFGDNISTDYIKPGFARGETLEEQAEFCMRAIRPGCRRWKGT
jgi:3-isopropylmalate dehydratase small subunit